MVGREGIISGCGGKGADIVDGFRGKGLAIGPDISELGIFIMPSDSASSSSLDILLINRYMYCYYESIINMDIVISEIEICVNNKIKTF